MSIPLGIFSRSFTQPTLNGLLDAVQAHGLKHVHFNLASAGSGIDNFPESIDDELCRTVREAFTERKLTMCSASGTFNAIDAERDEREPSWIMTALHRDHAQRALHTRVRDAHDARRSALEIAAERARDRSQRPPRRLQGERHAPT